METDGVSVTSFEKEKQYTLEEQCIFDALLSDDMDDEKARGIIDKFRTNKKIKIDQEKTIKTPKTQTIFAIDRSGSMQSYGSDSYGSVQTAISNLPEDRDDPYAHISILTFDDQIEWINKDLPAKDFILSKEAMRPRNTTALRDAILEVINYTENLKDDSKKFIIIFTDGEDNSSKTSVKDLKKRIEQAKEKGIDFTFLAAGESHITDATDIGIGLEDTLSVGRKGSHMRSAMRSAGRKVLSGFTQDQRDEADSD